MRLRRISILTLAVWSVPLAGAHLSAQTVTVVRVDADAPGPSHNGQTWCTAYTDIQQALDAAGADTEIRVAEGTYTPDPPDGDPLASFHLQSGVALLGGFAGCGATDPDQRDLTLFETILSGDLNADDTSGGSNIENSYHVVTGDGADSTAILDGFTITAGHANGPNPSDRGGAIFLFPAGGSPTIRNCHIRDNTTAAKGGGFYAFNYGGAMTDCIFTGNASTDGGAFYNLQGSPTLTGCDFNANEASKLGGAMVNFGGNPTLTDCAFTGNRALGGGAMFNTSGGTPAELTVTHCLFVQNEATGAGTPSGGAIHNQKSSPALIGCVFNGNTADARGGGMDSIFDSHPTVVNCVFSHNTASSGGGVRNNSSSSDTTIINSVFWNNSDDDGITEAAQVRLINGSISIDYSCVQGLTGALGGVGNIGEAPSFLDEDGIDDVPGTPDDDFRLDPDSPCANTGSPASLASLPATDLDGQARIMGCRIDMGPYESGRPQTAGDFTADDLIDLADVAAFQHCYGAPVNNPSWADTCLCVFDDDGNGEIDLSDFDAFRLVMDGR